MSKQYRDSWSFGLKSVFCGGRSVVGVQIVQELLRVTPICSGSAIRTHVTTWNESGFRPPLCTYRLNWARRTSWGWWDEWDDTVLQTQNSKFEPWRFEAEHATSRSRRLPTILSRTHVTVLKLPSPGIEPPTLTSWCLSATNRAKESTPWPEEYSLHSPYTCYTHCPNVGQELPSATICSKGYKTQTKNYLTELSLIEWQS